MNDPNIVARSIPPVTATLGSDSKQGDPVKSRKFVKRYRLAARIRDAVRASGVSIPTDKLYIFDGTTYSPFGRRPEPGEWEQLGQLESLIELEVSPATRVELRRADSTRTIISWSIGLLIVVVSTVWFCLSLKLFLPDQRTLTGVQINKPGFVVFSICYMAWAFSFGGLGAAANLSTNALLQQSDVKFDLLDTSLLKMRMVVGGLFGLFGSVGLSPLSFWSIITASTSTYDEVRQIFSPDLGEHVVVSDVFRYHFVGFIFPFLLGFSTSLVLKIISRLVESIETFFGLAPTRSESADGPIPTRSPQAVSSERVPKE